MEMANRSEKEEIVNGVIYRYGSDWIYTLESEEHWRLYWRQQKIMQNRVSPGEKVLELGVGSGFTANYLRSKGVEVITLDIDAEKKPDIVANLVTYEFKDEFDHILGFEVFEHVPFVEFETAIRKLSKVCRKNFFVSVPCNELNVFKAAIKVPLLREWHIQISVPRGIITEKHHFWEVGHRDTSRRKFETAFERAGFALIGREKAFSRLFYTFQREHA